MVTGDNKTTSNSASNKRFGVVVSRYNENITSALLDGAVKTLKRHGATAEQITQIWVPGAFEIPAAAMALAETGQFAAIVCLGCLIKGETAHFDYISQAAAHGISRVSLDTGVPCTFGVLTVDTLEQALARATADGDNKGAEAALAAIEMAQLMEKFRVE